MVAPVVASDRDLRALAVRIVLASYLVRGASTTILMLPLARGAAPFAYTAQAARR